MEKIGGVDGVGKQFSYGHFGPEVYVEYFITDVPYKGFRNIGQKFSD